MAAPHISLWASQVSQWCRNPPANARDSGDLGLIPGLGKCPGGGNGNPLHCPCLDNPRDGGAWWAAVYGVAQSRTRLKRLSSSSLKPSSLPLLIFSLPLLLLVQQLLSRVRLFATPLTAVTSAAAKSLQSCPTLCDPIDGSPPCATP